MSKDLDWKFEEELAEEIGSDLQKSESPEEKTVPSGNGQSAKSKKAKVAIIVLSIVSSVAICTSIVFFAHYISCRNSVKKMQQTIDSQEVIISSVRSSYSSLESKYQNLKGEYEDTKNNYNFLYNNAACVDDTYSVTAEDADWYHHPDCSFFDDSSYWIYNVEAAKYHGYRPCPFCWK